MLRSRPARQVGVVACHACSHLTDALVSMCIEAGVDFAVMPCCHRDLHTQGQMGIVAKSFRLKEHEVIDIARLGGIVARGYDCRWRTIDASITPENRMLVGLANLKPNAAFNRLMVQQTTDAKLSHIYAKIHGFASDPYAAGPEGADKGAAAAEGAEAEAEVGAAAGETATELANSEGAKGLY